MFALALGVSAQRPCVSRLEVRLSNTDQVVSLVLALAMLEIEMGSPTIEIGVSVANPGAVRNHAETIEKQAVYALSKGCRVCSLSEAALCL